MDKIALVHEWFVDYSGSERVVEQILNIFPNADVFAVVEFLPPALRGFIQNKPVHTTFVQRLPFAKTRYRNYLPIMPLAIEQFDLSAYDLVISSSHAVAKGVITGPDQLHISYVHSPIRYAWDFQHQYLREAGLDKGLRSWLARWVLHKVRSWDVQSANRVDEFIANSHFIKRRIQKVYRRDATTIHPPVDVERYSLRENKDDFYLTASRMVPYKRVGLVVEAFARMPDKQLVVIGDGPEYKRVKQKAGANTTFLGYTDNRTLRDHMQRAKAFVFASEEDFGITTVEAQASGTPVITFAKGGALDTVRGLGECDPTGVFFYQQLPEAIIDAVQRFEREGHEISAQSCRVNAEKFSAERFRREFSEFVTFAWEKFQCDKNEGSRSSFDRSSLHGSTVSMLEVMEGMSASGADKVRIK